MQRIIVEEVEEIEEEEQINNPNPFIIENENDEIQFYGDEVALDDNSEGLLKKPSNKWIYQLKHSFQAFITLGRGVKGDVVYVLRMKTRRLQYFTVLNVTKMSVWLIASISYIQRLDYIAEIKKEIWIKQVCSFN